MIQKLGIELSISKNTIIIRCGDIWVAEGKKVIPFNEYFDTCVDDRIITSQSLHGQLIIKLGKRLSDLKKAIDSDISRRTLKNGRMAYPLGSILPFENYLLLAFSSFDEKNRANLSKKQYIGCLKKMWDEIDITYGNFPIFLPLLGSGVTRIDASNQDLLEWMLDSLGECKVTYNRPLTILLTEEILTSSDINKKVDLEKIRRIY